MQALMKKFRVNGIATRGKVVTLFEYEYLPYRELGLHANHPYVLRLTEMNERAEREIIRLERGGIRATQFVGAIRAGSLSLHVLPKIDYEGVPESGDGDVRLSERSATSNLVHMLSYARDLKLRNQDVAALSSGRSDWLEVMTKLFATDLHIQMQRGMSRAYVRIAESLPVMRGRWDVTGQLARRPHVKHLFDVVYDEFSEDTPLNRVFRFVIERLMRRTRDVETRRKLRDLENWTTDVRSLPEVTREDLQRAATSISSLNQRYRVAFNLAHMFIEDEMLRLSSGSTDAYAFVFDMNELFEEFIARFVESHRDEVLPDGWKGALIDVQSKGNAKYLLKRIGDGKDYSRLKPDLRLESVTGGTALVLDTKYKPLKQTRRKSGVSPGDLYQMLAYANRFRCPRTLMLYPRQRGRASVRDEYEAYVTGVRLLVATVDLQRPLDSPTNLATELREIFEKLLGGKQIYGQTI